MKEAEFTQEKVAKQSILQNYAKQALGVAGVVLIVGIMLHFVFNKPKIVQHIKQQNNISTVTPANVFVNQALSTYEKSARGKLAQTEKLRNSLLALKEKQKAALSLAQKKAQHDEDNDLNNTLGVGGNADVVSDTKKSELISLMQSPVYFQGDVGASSGNSNTNGGVTRLYAQHLAHPEWTLLAGSTVIPIVFETQINTQLPGTVIAKTLYDVYSKDGLHKILPAGSTLVGTSGQVSYQSQNRIGVAWQNITTPQNIRVALDNTPVSGDNGAAGTAADSINTHFVARFGEAALYSIISAGTASADTGNGAGYSPQNAYQTGVAQSFAQTAAASLHRNQNMPTTLGKQQGKTGVILVRNDLDFYGAYHQ